MSFSNYNPYSICLFCFVYRKHLEEKIPNIPLTDFHFVAFLNQLNYLNPIYIWLFSLIEIHPVLLATGQNFDWPDTQLIVKEGNATLV